MKQKITSAYIGTYDDLKMIQPDMDGILLILKDTVETNPGVCKTNLVMSVSKDGKWERVFKF